MDGESDDSEITDAKGWRLVMRFPLMRIATVVFIASFCTLVLEIVASRILAPYVGVSLYTWTSVIGVVLAGISVGAYAGGVLADRRPQESTLGWLLLASGVSALLVGPATDLLAGDAGLLTAHGIATTLLQRVVLLSLLLFFLPAFVLGMISPVAVKIAVRNLDTAGSVVGKIYAFSTLGSIAGTFVTGFWLIARFGSRATVIGVGVVLIATALLLGGLIRGRTRGAAALFIALVALFFAFRRPELRPPPTSVQVPGNGLLHRQESQYYTIRVQQTVREDTGAPLRELRLDYLAHSFTDLADPSYFEYEYLTIFKEIIERHAAERSDLRLLFIGGGGYTLPRWIEGRLPNATIDVVEIDPAVTRVAGQWFGLPRNTRVRSVNEDARWFAMRPTSGYDVILLDVFNDLSVPYHLTTAEFAATLQRHLRPGGTIVANLIDDFEKGRFLASYVRTLQSLFGRGNVVIIRETSDSEGRETFVVAASSVLRLPNTGKFLLGTQRDDYVRRRGGIVLTDDYAPVDNMLAPLFVARFADEMPE